MKEIYENIFDKDLIKKHGERIHHRGGMTALQQNYYTLLSVLGYLIDQEDLIETQSFWCSTTSKRLFLNVGMEIGSGDEKWRH